MESTLDDSSLSLGQDIIGFWYRWRFNPKSLIQLLETLLVELLWTHY